MTTLLRAPSDEDLMPEIVAYAVPPFESEGKRCKPLLRIKRVGQVYFVEQMRQKRSLGPDGKELVEDDWTSVAVAKPPDARKDAFGFLWDANRKLIEISATSP